MKINYCSKLFVQKAKKTNRERVRIGFLIFDKGID